MNCTFCEVHQDLPFTCPYCEKTFCLKHRLPENHQCSNIPRREPLGSVGVKENLRAMPTRSEKADLKVAVRKVEAEHTFLKRVRRKLISF